MIEHITNLIIPIEINRSCNKTERSQAATLFRAAGLLQDAIEAWVRAAEMKAATGIPPLDIKNLLESKPVKSGCLV